MSSFPVKSKTVVTPNKGKASIVVQTYSNRLFVVILEIDSGSPGTLIEFRRDLSAEVPATGGDSAVYDIKVLFGGEKPEVLLAARVLGSRIYKSGVTEKPILFGIGLKRFDKPLLEEVAGILVEILKGNY